MSLIICTSVMWKVQEYWVTYTQKVDHMVEEALKSNIKKSMKKLSRAINGDSKTQHSPLFKVLVALGQATPQNTPKVAAVHHTSGSPVWGTVQYYCSI